MKGRLIALSSAAVLAVYTAGYARTRSAAELLEAEERRPPMPRPGSQDRTPISAAPQQARLVPAATSAPAIGPGPQAVEAAGRAAAQENIDKSRRGPDATPEKGLVRAAADVASAASAATRSSQPAQGASAPAAPVAAQASAVPQIASAATSASEAGQAPHISEAPSAASFQASAAPAPEAPAVAAAPAAPAAPAALKWKDGRYTGWGTSRHGDLQATVFIENGKIATASISQCLTRYPCDWIRPLPPQVVQRQSAEVDYVSGATESTNAFYYAVLQALGKATQ